MTAQIRRGEHMTEQYTPTTEEVRQVYGLYGLPDGLLTAFDAFDRWLAARDAQVAERAWDEGFDRGFYSGQAMPSDADASESPVRNPYEADRIEGGTSA